MSKLCSIFFLIIFFLLQLAKHRSEFDFFTIACGQKGNIVYPHWQVIGHPLKLLDTLAQGTLCRGKEKKKGLLDKA